MVFIISLYTSNNLISNKKIEEENINNILLYYNGEKESYKAILEIPKINLKRGFYDINSKENNVNKNILLVKPSDMPDIENGLLILASHSGNSNVSFFKNLDKLNIKDEIKVNYENIEYIYYIEDIYDEPKDGKLSIYRDNKRSTIALITCNRKNKFYQTIYIGYRKDD